MTKTAFIPIVHVVNLRDSDKFCFCVELLLLYWNDSKVLQKVYVFLLESVTFPIEVKLKTFEKRLIR